MRFEELFSIFKKVSNFEELIFLLQVIKRNDLDLVNKHSGYVNGYDFDELTKDECLAMKYGCSTARKMKYKNLSKNFELRNPKNIDILDVKFITTPSNWDIE